VILFCVTGMYTVNNSVVDIWMMALFGGVGFLLRKLDYEAAPLLLALVLGPKLEVAFRQSLMISHGDFHIFPGPAHFNGISFGNAALFVDSGIFESS